ncbi:MAG TPA: hypothetical protein PLS50_01670 [Candidatus Dojkabacteria bacterium]|nr:hypothetical protein [Candidatus Dojkabacteria bacterium]
MNQQFFHLEIDNQITAYGCQFSDGKCAVNFEGPCQSIVTWESVEELQKFPDVRIKFWNKIIPGLVDKMEEYLNNDSITIVDKFNDVMREFNDHVQTIIEDYAEDNCFCDGSCGDNCRQYWSTFLELKNEYPVCFKHRNHFSCRQIYILQLNKIVKNGLSLIKNKHND